MIRPCLLTSIVLCACGPADTGASDTATTAATTTATSTSTATATATTTAAASTGAADGSEASTATPTTGDPTQPDPTTTATSSTGESSDTGSDSSTGEAAFCQGWETAEGAPYLVLHDRLGNVLAPGSTLPIECGGQGQFMFGLYPTFGGFVPPGDILDFKLVVDVEGFNKNPEGHFYSADPVGYYVSCEQIIGGIIGVLPVFPFDNLDNLMALDGKPAQVHVTMPTGDVPVTVDVDVVLAVVKDDSWALCGG